MNNLWLFALLVIISFFEQTIPVVNLKWKWQYTEYIHHWTLEDKYQTDNMSSIYENKQLLLLEYGVFGWIDSLWYVMMNL